MARTFVLALVLRVITIMALVVAPLAAAHAHAPTAPVVDSMHSPHAQPDGTASLSGAHDAHTSSVGLADCSGSASSPARHSGDSADTCCYGMCFATGVIDTQAPGVRHDAAMFFKDDIARLVRMDLIVLLAPPRS
ncbi:hypothetical protein [Breoghania sp. L-A4]|uniref:hypothetical protein n=1 Tax=Breoghania sp. L-A4 TaxID=2304600 RepID=UPI000E358940|nr:hypothetical protein [Breoghania sp. L-A4]AXS42101.1 hypothetical protein D1F64_21480 [Breoghania sp. L-A4]